VNLDGPPERGPGDIEHLVDTPPVCVLRALVAQPHGFRARRGVLVKLRRWGLVDL
jgi:hypothetical protein